MTDEFVAGLFGRILKVNRVSRQQVTPNWLREQGNISRLEAISHAEVLIKLIGMRSHEFVAKHTLLSSQSGGAVERRGRTSMAMQSGSTDLLGGGRITIAD